MKEISERWLAWQREHTAALEALQEAQRAYHRAAVGNQQLAVGSPPSREALRRDRSVYLEALDAARIRLDQVRARKPE